MTNKIHYYVKVPNLYSELPDHNFQYAAVPIKYGSPGPYFPYWFRSLISQVFFCEYKMLEASKITLDFDRFRQLRKSYLTFWYKRGTILIWNLYTIMLLMKGRIWHIDFFCSRDLGNMPSSPLHLYTNIFIFILKSWFSIRISNEWISILPYFTSLSFNDMRQSFSKRASFPIIDRNWYPNEDVFLTCL